MKNHKDFAPQRPKTIDPDNHIYTKLVTFPSREISRITHSFSKSSNQIGSSFFAEQEQVLLSQEKGQVTVRFE